MGSTGPEHDKGLSKTALQEVGIAVSPSVAFSIAVLNKLWDPIAEYVGYPCDRHRRMEDHRNALDRVLAMREDLLRNDPLPSTQQSKLWLTRVKALEDDALNNRGAYGSWNFIKNCRCAREALKETKRADDLASQFKDIMVEAKPRLQPVVCTQWGGYHKSSFTYYVKVINFINNTCVESKCLGIWGMAGVGKTAVVKHAVSQSVPVPEHRRSQSQLTLKVLFIDCGADCTVSKVQRSIFGHLGLTPALDVTESALAFAISNILSGLNFLLVLDGLSVPLDLTAVGIPDQSVNQNSRSAPGPLISAAAPPAATVALVAPSRNTVPDHHPDIRSRVLIKFQKVIITTQSKSICASMGCDETIQMLCPSATDALDIFTQALGIEAIQDERIFQLANTIIKECGRVPEALNKVGRSLSIVKHPDEWSHALKLIRQLKMCMLTDKSDNLVDRLRQGCEDLDENVKTCFLLCSLWNQDAIIPIDSLVEWWIGLNLIDDFEEGLAYVRLMQNFSLLEEGKNNGISDESTHVRLNPLIQNIGIQMLNDSGEKCASNSMWRLPLTQETWLKARKVWLLPSDLELLRRNKFLGQKLTSKLNMLIVRCDISLGPFLARCKFDAIKFLDIQDVSVGVFPQAICLLITLEYLNVSNTDMISIPRELVKITNLKHLILKNNRLIAELPEGIIGKFYKLKQLDVFCTRCMLTSVFHKELEESNCDKLMLGLTITSNVKKRLLELNHVRFVVHSICLLNMRTPTINLNWLLPCNKLRKLRIEGCEVVNLVAQSDIQDAQHSILDSFQIVELHQLSNLQAINFQMTFLSISTVTICETPMLVNLTWIERLINLEHLNVSRCTMIETLVSADVAIKRLVRMPKLRRLSLEGLPTLSSLSNVPIELECLTYFSVFNCANLTSLFAEKRNRKKITLNCAPDFWEQISQDGKEEWFIKVVA